MEPRITTSELAYYVQRQFGTDPYDFALEFFKRWLRAEPSIFLHECRIQEEDFKVRTNRNRERGNPDRIDEQACRTDSHPDLFLTVDTPNGDPIVHPPGAMEAQEWVLRRRFVFNILRKVGGPEDKLGKIYNAKLEECRALTKTAREGWQLEIWDHEVYPYIADALHITDLNEDQWMTIHRITMTQALAIRYCLHVYGEVPLKVLNDFKRKYTIKPKAGRRSGGDSLTNVYADCLEKLVSSGLHDLRKDGLVEAVTQIIDVWETPIAAGGVRKGIEEKYSQLLRDAFSKQQAE